MGNKDNYEKLLSDIRDRAEIYADNVRYSVKDIFGAYNGFVAGSVKQHGLTKQDIINSACDNFCSVCDNFDKCEHKRCDKYNKFFELMNTI